MTVSSLPTVKPLASSDWTRSATSAVAPTSSLLRSPTMVEVRITPTWASMRALMITTSGVNPRPVMARLSVPLPVYEPLMRNGAPVTVAVVA